MKRRNAQRLVRSIKASGATIFASQVADEFELRGAGLVTENHVIEYMRRLLSALSDAPAPQEAAPGEGLRVGSRVRARGSEMGGAITYAYATVQWDDGTVTHYTGDQPLSLLVPLAAPASQNPPLPEILCGACGNVLDVRRVDGRYLATGYCPACPDEPSPAPRAAKVWCSCCNAARPFTIAAPRADSHGLLYADMVCDVCNLILATFHYGKPSAPAPAPRCDGSGMIPETDADGQYTRTVYDCPAAPPAKGGSDEQQERIAPHVVAAAPRRGGEARRCTESPRRSGQAGGGGAANLRRERRYERRGRLHDA